MASSVHHEEDEFVQQMKEWSNGTSITLGLALAYETGVMSAMEELGKPASAVEIASVSKCKPRYVQELLEHLVVAGVVKLEQTSVDLQQPLFLIPAHCWKGLKSMYMTDMPLIAMLSHSHDALLECFKMDGPAGLLSDHVTSAHRSLGQDAISKWEIIILSAFDSVPGLITNLENGIRFLDIGCNIGQFILTLAEKFPKSKFVGFDVDPDAITKAQNTSRKKGLQNLEYLVLDAAHLPADWSERFDIVSAIDVIHDLPYPSKTCKETVRVLKHGGTTFFVDPPAKPFLKERVNDYFCQLSYTSSLYYCMSLSLAQPGSEGLSTCVGQSALCELYQAAGLSVVKVETIPPGYFAYISCIKP